MVKWWKPVTLGIVLTFIAGIISYAITQRAIIEYYLESPDSFNLQSESYLKVTIKFQNKGSTDASIVLRVTVENATILNDTIKFPHILLSNSTAEFYYAATAKSEGEQILHVVPDNNTEVFRVSCVVEKRLYPSFSEFLSWIFGEVKGYYPSSLIFKRSNANTFQKIES